MITDKHIKKYLQNLAEKIDGKYTDYTDDSIIFTLPLEDKRYQQIKGFLRDDEKGVFLQLCSKVCALQDVPEINFREMLEYNHKLVYGKTVITNDDFLEIYASVRYDLCTYEEVKTVLFEVGQHADQLEHELTGADVY